MSTDPSPALQLLRLLTAGASTAEIGAVDADPEARDLALRIRSAFDSRRRREAELTALVDTARDLAALRDPSVILGAIVRRARALLGTDVAYLTLYDAQAGDTFMRATDGSVSARFQSVRLSLGRRPRRAGRLDAPAVLDRRLLRRPAVRAHRGRSTPPSATRAWWPSAAPRCWSTPSSSACCSPPTGLPAPSPARRWRCSGSLAALAAVSILQTRAAADTAEALERLSEAHAAVHRHTAGVERAAAAHDRFAELVLAGGGVDDITAALAELTGGWVVAAGRDRSPAELHRARRRRSCRCSRRRPPRLGPAGPPGRHVGRDGQGRLEQLGFLVIGGVQDLDDPDRRTIERAGVVTALLLLFERAAADAEQRMRTDLVSDLVSGRGDAAVRAGARPQPGARPRQGARRPGRARPPGRTAAGTGDVGSRGGGRGGARG